LAALLHAVVEDANTEVAEIRRRFGPEVGDLVAEMPSAATTRVLAAHGEAPAAQRQGISGPRRCHWPTPTRRSHS